MNFLSKISTLSRSKKRNFLFFCFGTFFLLSCNVTKKIPADQYLLEKAEILNTKETKIEKQEFEAFVRQKPNRKLFRSLHFYVWWYNIFDEEKIKRKKEKRNLKYDKRNADKVKRFEEINAKREKKGKKPRLPKLKDKESFTLLESLRDIGEAPVILDSALTEQTRDQLSKFLFSKGFFNNAVTDSVTIDLKNKKAFVNYYLIPKLPYVINSITYQLDDPKLGELILQDTIHTLLKRGMVYTTEKFQEERLRITNHALNNGYFYFQNAFIKYDIDSNFNSRSVSVKILLKKFAQPYSSSNDSLVYVNHTKYKIENVYLITEAVAGNLREIPFKDTLITPKSDVIFLLNKPIAYRPSILYHNVDIHKNQLFRSDTAEITYKALLGLGIFRTVSIQFLKSLNSNSRLDCYIVCVPLIKQSITAETEGINTSGNLGVDGSLVFQNKNFFKGGELVELKLQGAFIAQQQFNEKRDPNINQLQKTFNTIQFGPEATFSVPRAFFPFSLLPFKKEMSPRTFVKSSLNYQARPEFSRVITDVNYGFNFKTFDNRLKHELVPFQAYLVRAKLASTFSNSLTTFNDAFLLNSFQDHITTITKYGVTYISKENTNTSKRTVSYVHLNLQSSGNILRQYFISNGRPRDSLGRFLIIGIPFAQFLRADIDYRIYIPIRKKSRVVYRLAGGIGKPLANLKVLPYEQSFFSGGPNSVRAWRARTLGPGGYRPEEGNNTRYDKIGDMLLEGNFEYRFHIIKSFNGAIFADAGNIWRLDKDENKPRAEFIVDEFYKQIAIGGGMGIRWDLSFFVLRVDLAVPLRDPKYEPESRWTFDKQPWKQIVTNFGIGYPF